MDDYMNDQSVRDPKERGRGVYVFAREESTTYRISVLADDYHAAAAAASVGPISQVMGKESVMNVSTSERGETTFSHFEKYPNPAKKKFLVKDLSGRGYTGTVALEDMGDWDKYYTNDETDENEPTLGEWMKSAELGDEYHHLDDNTQFICVEVP